MDQQMAWPGDRLWTVLEVSEFLQLKPFTVRAMVRRGRLPAIVEGQRIIRFVPDEIKTWIEERRRRTRKGR